MTASEAMHMERSNYTMKRIPALNLLISLGLGMALLTSAAFAQGTAKGEKPQMGMMPERPMITKAVCVLHPLGDSKVSGTVTFTKVENGIQLTADLTGLTPGNHGFHIHQWGDCSSPDGKSAGGHFNPGNEPHAGPDADRRHVGDLGNITAGDDGTAHYSRVDTHIAFHGPDSIIGRGMIVHAGTDDLTTQPTGDAGGRVACGVIGVAAP